MYLQGIFLNTKICQSIICINEYNIIKVINNKKNLKIMAKNYGAAIKIRTYNCCNKEKLLLTSGYCIK